MPDEDSDSEDVRELMAASASAGSAAVAALLAGLRLAAADVDAVFQQAVHFVAVVDSRMRSATDLRLWELDAHRNRLWALRQQALVGSCEASRGTKSYALLVAQEVAKPTAVWPPPCCLRMAGESKLKLWQELGDMPSDEAQVRYIRVLTDAVPSWTSPPSTDSALLRTWTPDSDSDRCALCAEAFTFLNRRHHCRRCASLVCAVCSPHAVPLRVFSRPSDRPQRVCSQCYDQIQATTTTTTSSSTSSSSLLLLLSDPKAHAPPPISTTTTTFAIEDEPLDAVPPALPPPPRPARLAPLATAVSATIQCGSLECLQPAGFRKAWRKCFFVLLLRKGSLGLFLTESDHVEHRQRPAAVFKLSGYAVRVKSQPRRPHQWRLTHAAAKKPALHLAAASIEDMNLWISQLIKAIDSANALERDKDEAAPVVVV